MFSRYAYHARPDTHTIRRLHYFQACTIMVVSQLPLSDIMNNRDATSCIIKWALELLPFEINSSLDVLSNHKF
jgi:hypothetical protein